MTDPTDFAPRPDLQEWVARYGGYPNIPWDKWDAAMAAWEKARRDRLLDERVSRETP